MESSLKRLLDNCNDYHEKKKEVCELHLKLKEEAKKVDIESFISFNYEELKEIDRVITPFLSEESLESFRELLEVKKKKHILNY